MATPSDDARSAANARLQEPQGTTPDTTAQGQAGIVADLESALAQGEITQDQYTDALGMLYEAHANAQAQDLAGIQTGPGAAGEEPPPDEGLGLGPAGLDPAAPPDGVTFADPSADPLGAMDSDTSLLARPTDRPNEPLRAGLGRAQTAAVPPEVIQAIPALIEAAKDPNAPPGLHALLDLLDYHINKQPEVRKSIAKK